MALRYHTRTQTAACVKHDQLALSGDASPSFMAPQMSRIDDGLPNPLPEELDRALRRATDRTLSALTALRKSVLLHVSSERDRGVSLSQIKLDLQEIISRVKESAANDGDGDGEHEIIAAEVFKWTDGFYKRSD
jgi:hypothetical protein